MTQQPGWTQNQGAQHNNYPANAQYPAQAPQYTQNQQYAQQRQGQYQQANTSGYYQQAEPASEPTRNKKHGTGVVMTAALLAALVGAGVGAGVGGGIAASSGGTSSVGSGPSKNSGGTSSNLTSTDPTVITETAKNVLPSTVTVQARDESKNSKSTGTGEVLDTQGHIMTNFHVIADENRKNLDYFEVRFADGTVRKAKLVGGDATADIAVIKVDPKGLELSPIKIGDSSKLVSGDTVIALGSPHSQENTVTSGIVSNTFRVRPAIKDGAYIPMIQTDTALNHGNSGGPLVNTRGELVGINARIFVDEQSGTVAGGIAYAIPANYAKRVADEIISKGKAMHGYLGASIEDSPSETESGDSQLFYGGVAVTNVSSGGPADKAGLKKGDVVLEADGHRIDESKDLNGIVRAQAAGSTLTFKVKRGSETKEVKVTLGDSESQK